MYGDDGMDPVTMEGKDGKPMDFDRLLAQVWGGGRGFTLPRVWWWGWGQ